mmetsp:Transcript_19189/g.39125  ORF Transcript_19189/g.39125 Transcript_19189/m.39125 type:complete len:200 (-) Transcript_19189:211-810(-)
MTLPAFFITRNAAMFTHTPRLAARVKCSGWAAGIAHARERSMSGNSSSAAPQKSHTDEMGLIQNCPSITPILRFLSSFWARTSRTASDTSAASIISSPSAENEPSPSEAMAVPTQIPATLSVTRREGTSMRVTQRRVRVTTGVKALSIWMYATGRCRYTAFPKERVAAIAAPTGIRLEQAKGNVTRSRCSSFTQPSATT